MYRIELSPGEQTAFRSIEELAVAIRRGVVTPHARIWHNTSSKWLPIQFHPHYKIAASMQLTPADLVAGPPVRPLELLTLGELVDPPAPPARPLPAPEPKPAPRRKEPRKEARKQPAREAVQQDSPEPRVANVEPSKPMKAKRTKTRRPRGGGGALRLALAGSVVLAGLQLVYSAISSAGTESLAERPRSHRRLVAEPAAPAQGSPETTAANVIPGIPAVTRPNRSPAKGATSESTPAPEAAAPPATSSFGASSVETTDDIALPPTGSAVVAAPSINTDSLAPRIVDSSGTKALKGVLRAIAPPAGSEAKRSTR